MPKLIRPAFSRRKRFTAGGTWVIPYDAGLARLKGAGGGGGGAATSSTDLVSAGGGGGSRYETFFDFTPYRGQTATIAIGAAGTGTPNGTAQGGTGGDTTITIGGTVYVRFKGASGGYNNIANSGLGGTGAGLGGDGGRGGTGAGVDGTAGQHSKCNAADGHGEGGAGGSNNGGGSGGGGGGGGYNDGNAGAGGNASAPAASGYGGGGGGGGKSAGGGNASGGDGSPGILDIEW